MARIKAKVFNHKGLLFLILIFLFIIGINLLSFFLKRDDLDIKIKSQEVIYLSSKLPITDASGKKLNVLSIQDGVIGYSEFEIELDEDSDDVLNYEIYLTDITGGNTFKYDYIKVYLTDGEDVPFQRFDKNQVPSYKELRTSLDEPEKKVLFTGKIKSGEKKTFRLRVWLADTYVLDGGEKEFKGEISVKAVS